MMKSILSVIFVLTYFLLLQEEAKFAHANNTNVSLVYPDSIKSIVVVPYEYDDMCVYGFNQGEFATQFGGLKPDTLESDDGTFKYSFSTDKPLFLKIYGITETKREIVASSREPQKYGPGEIPIEPGDSININLVGVFSDGNVVPANIRFSGRGSVKHQCQQLIKQRIALASNKSVEGIREKAVELREIIQSFRPRMSEGASVMLLVSNFTRLFTGQIISLQVNRKSETVDRELRELIAEFVPYNDTLTKFSGDYCDLLIHHFAISFMNRENSAKPIGELNSEFLTYLEMILLKSQMRNQVIGNYIAQCVVRGSSMKPIQEAIERFNGYPCNTPHLQQALACFYRRQMVIAGGFEKAYDFALKDTFGNVVRLSDYSGKVVLIDFMFTGCGNCIKSVPYLKSIKDGFSKEDFVSISISTDRKNEWRMGGDFPPSSVPGSVFLYTLDQGFKHEVIKQYRVKGMPTLVLVDKRGNLVANPAPDPRADSGVGLKGLIDRTIYEAPR